MIKKKLVELVQTKLAGGQINSDIWKKAHPLVVSEYIGLAMNTLLYQVYKDDIDSLDAYAKDMVVDVNSGAFGYYSTLPKSTLQFPGNDSGITRISLTEDDVSLVFAKVSSSSKSAYSRLGTTKRLGILPYRFSAGTVLFGKDPRMDNIKKVVISAILPFSELDDKDDIVIPLGTGVSLVDTIIHLIADNKPQDKSVNNVAD